MGSLDVDAASDDFADRSSAFLKWFARSNGTRLSTKVQLADLRFRGAGRGAGVDCRASEVTACLQVFVSFS